MGVLHIRQRAARWPQAEPLPLPQVLSFLLLLISLLALSQALSRARIAPIPLRQNPPVPIWGEKPVLGYFVFTGSLAERLPAEARLNAGQMVVLEHAARQEVEALRALEMESRPIVADPQLTLEQKRQKISALDYNGRIQSILRASDRTLRSGLGAAAYGRLIRWVERQWVVEKELHGERAAGTAAGAPSAVGALGTPRTYRIFATRYDSGGAYTVALPDQCLKFANKGSHLCDGDGYTAGAGYTVFMSYQKSAAATVGEAGPWNVDDNFWAASGDPTPRRMFADLPLGMPEAQAAYFDGYNGGADQYGRQVTAPFGIDLARQVSIDIGLEPGKNDWIDVSFMWTEGWDGGSAAQPGQTAAPQLPAAIIMPVQTAAPKPDGSIVHVVQEGQALWHIADAYQVSLAQIMTLNGLAEGAVIFPAQELLIRAAATPFTPTSDGSGTAAAPTGTAVQAPTPERTLAPPTSSITPPVTKAAALAQAGEQTAGPGQPLARSPGETLAAATLEPAGPASTMDPLLAAILGIMLAGMGLLLFGVWYQRKA